MRMRIWKIFRNQTLQKFLNVRFNTFEPFVNHNPGRGMRRDNGRYPVLNTAFFNEAADRVSNFDHLKFGRRTQYDRF
ncbi:hypothetical protein D1872_278560 [compost metagenome]